VKLSDLRLIPAVETWPRAVALAERPVGKLVRVALFAALLWLNRMPGMWELSALALPLTFVPRYRRALVLLGTAYWFVRFPPIRWDRVTTVAWRADTTAWATSPIFFGAVVAGTLLFFLAWLRLWRGRRFTILPLVALFLALMALAAEAPLGPVAVTLLWTFLFVWGRWFWYLGYTLHDRGMKDPTPLWQQLGRFTPYWSNRPTPIPKGEAYLQKIEAKSETDLAVTQLKALKLLFWAAALKLLFAVLYYVGYESELQIPPLSYLLSKHRDHADYELWRAWAGVSLHYVLKILRLAIRAHQAVALVRMAGWRALRNTYKPFLSTSILDFWNRLYYYFKELLVDFFLYPTYLRLSKIKDTRWRMFVATLAAAGAGNLLFHWIDDTDEVLRVGFWSALRSFHVYAVYCAILALGIALSQLARKRGPKRPQPWWLAALKIAGVTFFFGIISVLDIADPDTVVDRSLTIRDYASFVLSLFGVT
jgi:hypothetical protein